MGTASGGDLEYALFSRAADDEPSGVALCCPETSNRRRQAVQEGTRCHGNLPIPEATVRLGMMKNARSMLQTGISEVDQRVSICPLGTIGKSPTWPVRLRAKALRARPANFDLERRFRPAACPAYGHLPAQRCILQPLILAGAISFRPYHR